MARLSENEAFVHPDCEITACTFGRYVEIGRGSRIAHSRLGDYSYCDRYADIASFARIGPTDHPMDQASLHHFHYRSGDYWDDVDNDAAF